MISPASGCTVVIKCINWTITLPRVGPNDVVVLANVSHECTVHRSVG